MTEWRPPRGAEVHLMLQVREAWEGKEVTGRLLDPLSSLTANQAALAWAVALYVALTQPERIMEPIRRGEPGRPVTAVAHTSVSDWFDEQARDHGHCGNAHHSEPLSFTYHPGFWTVGVASLTRTSFRHRLTDVYRRCLRWWRSSLYLWQLLQVEDGKPLAVGCRSGAVKDARAAQVAWLLYQGRELYDWKSREHEDYWRGPAMVREMVEAGELEPMTVTAEDRPRIWNDLILRGRDTHRVLYAPQLDHCYGAPVWLAEVRDRKLIHEVSWRTLGKPWKQARQMGGGPMPGVPPDLPLIDKLTRIAPVPQLPPAPWSDEPAEPDPKPEPEPPVVDGARRVVGKLYNDGTYELEDN